MGAVAAIDDRHDALKDGDLAALRHMIADVFAAEIGRGLVGGADIGDALALAGPVDVDDLDALFQRLVDGRNQRRGIGRSEREALNALGELVFDQRDLTRDVAFAARRTENRHLDAELLALIQAPFSTFAQNWLAAGMLPMMTAILSAAEAAALVASRTPAARRRILGCMFLSLFDSDR